MYPCFSNRQRVGFAPVLEPATKRQVYPESRRQVYNQVVCDNVASSGYLRSGFIRDGIMHDQKTYPRMLCFRKRLINPIAVFIGYQVSLI